MTKRTCSVPECGKPHVARNYCKAHYNKLVATNRHPKRIMPCAFCGKEVLRSSGGGRVHGAACSDQCRQWLQTPYSILPADHWARWYGRTSAWKPPAKPAIQRTIECAWCGTTHDTLQSTAQYCQKSCARKASKARRRAREANSPGQYTWTQVIRLHLKAGKLCSYCDEPTREPEPDHVIPISRGGRNGIENILPCCHKCNSDKGDMTPAEWKANRARRGKPPVRTVFDATSPRFIHLMLGEAEGKSYRLTQEAHLSCG